MNRYALIKDSINDNIFGVVVDSNGLSKFYGVSAKGIEWSKWANGISVKSANDGLPAGIVVGEYSPLRNDNSGYVQALVDTVSLRNPSVNRKQGISDSLVKNSSSVTPSVRDAELRAFDTDKRADAINFKARAFRTDSKVTSLLTQVRAEKLGFVSSDGAFTSRNPVSIPEVKQAEIIDTYGRSIQRAIGKNLIRKKSARMVTVVRAVKQTASGIEFKAAGLGPKIGSRLSGGLRAAPAGMSFVDVTGVTDADTDGIVFEGKPGLERPIIPRFIVPKDLARKLSGIVEGDAEAIEKQRRAGNTSVQFDEGKLRKIIESVGGDANLLTAVTGEDGIPATTPSGRERLSVSAPKPSGIARDIARDAVIGGRLRSNQRPDLGDPTPLSPGELKKLSQQDLVDRLLEDRFAGLNLEEAARKYGLKGGRAEARRLEAREMQRRRNEGINMPDGMRSRQTTPSGNRLFTQEEFDAFFYDAVPFTEDADFRIYVSDPRDRGKWLKRDEVQVEAGNSFGEMLLDEFPGRLSFLDDVGYSLASFDTDDLSDEERIELSDALSYFPELLSGFEEYPSDGDGMRSRTTPPFVTREDGFNFDDQIDISDPDVEDAMWNWLGRPNDGELRKTGGLEKYWDRFKNSDEYRDLENDLLSDALKKSGATPKNPVTISSGSNKYVNATVKYDGEKFIIESQRWDVQAEKVVDGPGDGEEFDSLNEAEEFVSSVVGDSIGYEGMRSRSSSARKVRDFVTSELDDRTISKIRQQLKDIAGNVDEDSQPWEFDAEYLGDALGLTGRWGSVDEVEGALMKGIGDILDSVISGIEDRIADNPDQVNEYGALYDFASAVRNLLGRPDAEWTKPDVDDSEAILEFNDRPYLAIAKTDDGEFVVLQGTVLPSFDYYEQDSFDLEEIGGPFETMDEAIEAGNKAYRKERFSESMLSAQDDRMDIASTADDDISIEREAEDAWDNLNDLDKYRMVEEYAISRGANPGGNDWDPSEWEPDVMEQWINDYIMDREGDIRSLYEMPSQRVVDTNGAPDEYAAALRDELSRGSNPFLSEESYADPNVRWDAENNGWALSFGAAPGRELLITARDPKDAARAAAIFAERANEMFDASGYRGSDDGPPGSEGVRELVAQGDPTGMIEDYVDFDAEGRGLSIVSRPSTRGGMRSRSGMRSINWNGAPDEYVDALLEIDNDALSAPYGRPLFDLGNRALPQVRWDKRAKGWVLAFDDAPERELLITARNPKDAARILERLAERAKYMYDASGYDGDDRPPSTDGVRELVADGDPTGLIDDLVDIEEERKGIKVISRNRTYDRTPMGIDGFRSRSGMRSASDKPAQNLVQRTLERSDVGFGGYARWDDDTYDLFETAGRILDGEVFGGADYTEAFEDRRDRIADGEYLEELSDDDRQLVADIFDRAANASRQDGMRSRRGMRSARPRSDEPGLRDNQIAGDMTLVEYGILDDAIRLMRRDNKLSKEEVNSLEPLSDAIADASDGNDMIVMDRSDFARAKQAVDKWMSDPDNLPGGDVADLQDVLGEMENADEDGNIFTSLLLEEQGTRLSMPPASRGGMRSRFLNENIYLYHRPSDDQKAIGIADIWNVQVPPSRWDMDAPDLDVAYSDKIILSSHSNTPDGKVYIAEFDKDAKTITVRWGKANTKPEALTSKTYANQTRRDFFKLLYGKEKRGYRLEGGSIPPLQSGDERKNWFADHDEQRRQGLRSTTATDDRPYYNVPVTGSSALRQVSFDPKKNELIVTYANGKTYTYENFTGDDLNSALDDPNAPGGVGQGITGSIMNKIKKTHSFREGGQHTFDPEYQRITGPGQRTGRSRLSRSGSGTKTQIPVSESSAIEALTWDDKKKDLIVTYKGGRTYTYKDVDDYWVGDLEEDDAGTGRIINNIKKEGYQVIEGGEHGEMPSEGLTAERGRFGMRSRASREKNLPLTEWAGEKPGKENLKPNADLGGADLSNQDLSKYDLSGAVLGLSDLSDSKLPIGLDRANLDEAILEDVDGSFVSLTGASLNEAILSGSDFSNANMTEARLIDAFFYQANLSEANLKLAQAHTAYFDEANLEGANLENITATRASFKNANMRRANLAGADLRLADLRNADLTSANLENANITGANIDGADFEGANLEGVTLPDGWEIVDGEVQRVDENRTGIDGFRSRSGVQKYGSGVVSNGRILYQDDVSRINRGGKTRINIGNSRAVRAVTWDDDNRDLIVTFGSGRTYTYEGVNDDLIRELEEDPASVGSIINKIKNTRVPFTEGGTHAPQSTLYSEVQRQREALGMRSRMAPSASRIRAAEMEVSARPQGMASRRSEGLRDARFAVPGRDRVDPSDGQLWARLSDEDKKTVADRAVQREKFLLGEFKKRFPNWWRRANAEAEKNGWDKELMGGRNAGWLDELHRFVTKLSDDPNYPEKARLDAERDFNDLQALFNMRSNRGQHDLLEHLNPTSRRYLFDDARRADGKTTKISSSGKEMKTASTAPRPFGEPVDTGNPIREQVGEKQKKPLKERLDAFYKRMSDKILYEDPARKQRREMRKARRQGINVGGFTQAEANPVDDAKRKIRKRKRLKEMRKYRSRDVETISKESQKNRVDGKLAHTADSGEMVFGEKLVPTLSTMMENYRTSKKLKKTTGSTNRNKALAVLWDGAGYNGTPQIITPEEFKTLHAAGWVPVVRGHGTGPNGARYADDWIDSPIRFIPGQGGEAQGEGEYWARPTQGGGGWFSWMDSKLPAGTVALLPPSTRRVSKNELRKIQSEHAPLAKAIKQFDSGLPEGEREKMSAEEYVSGLRDYIQSTLGPTFESTMSTRMGKMTSQILDSLSGASGADKKQLLDALEFLELISKQRTVNSYAPLLGYDSIIADSGVELIHNRTAVVVVGDTFTRDDAVNLAKSKA